MTRHLPVELTTFVGRRKELAEGRRMVRAARVVTIVGPGGVGKTRLAVRLAHQVRRVFPDGVVWVDLAAQRDPGSLASEVATGLGVESQGQPALEAVATFLTSRQLLLVLDNCEHLVGACSELVTRLLLGAPDLRVVATSRQPLKVTGEHVMSLEPLAIPTPEEVAAGGVGHVEAVALLVDRARMVDAGFRLDSRNAELITRLVRGLDGIPLAIELAAARLRVLSLGQLVERLADRFGLLSTGPRATAPRHKTLRALIDWSHDLCSPEERALWARMSVFDGGADLAAVESVCGEPDGPLCEPLAGLVDKSVLTVTENDGRVRYRMLETIREYGAERLTQGGEAALVRDRHRDHFLALARESRVSWIGPDQLDWLGRVTVDLGNLRGAFEHSVNDDRGRTKALELATSLVWYWAPAGAPDEGANWFSRALAGPHEQSPSLLHALAAAAILAGDRSDVDTALAVAKRAVLLPYRHDQAVDRAAHDIAVATEALVTGDYSAAEAAYRRSLAAYQAADDLYGQLEALAMIGAVAGELGRAEEALSTFGEALDLSAAHGEVIVRGILLNYTGELLLTIGRRDESRAVLRQCLESWSTLRPLTISGVLYFLAKGYAQDGHERSATLLLGVRERIWDDHGLLTGPFGGRVVPPAVQEKLVASLGAEEFQTCLDEGYAMSRHDAIRVALGPGVSARAQPSVDTQPALLSKREQQVAELVTRGFSNKDIAEKLVISQRTAEGHVAKVMDKLGLRSREQVADWVTEREGSASW